MEVDLEIKLRGLAPGSPAVEDDVYEQKQDAAQKARCEPALPPGAGGKKERRTARKPTPPPGQEGPRHHGHDEGCSRRRSAHGGEEENTVTCVQKLTARTTLVRSDFFASIARKLRHRMPERASRNTCAVLVFC